MATKRTTSAAGGLIVSGRTEGFSVTAYCGDGSVLLAMNLDEKRTPNLAGFAIKRTTPSGKSSYLMNRLSFSTAYTSKSKAEDREWTPSNLAPFQKFRWIDFPPDIHAGQYHYEVTAMYFTDARLKAGPTVRVALNILPDKRAKFDIGFTRGYLSSQAYATRFQNKPIRPAGAKTIAYDTAPFADQYEWLGYHARTLVFEVLNEAVNDESITVDAFVYDIDEPDFIEGLKKLGSRLRVFMDDAPLHTGAAAPEVKVHKALVASAGAKNVKVGHFKRFAHNKVLILRRKGKPFKVLAGSANFSVRGLYVQANNVFLFNDDKVAVLYGQAFDEAFNDPTKSQAGFSKSSVSGQWFDIAGKGIPAGSVAFSPHHDPLVSLKKVADAIAGAKSSVLFAIMELGGGGPVLAEIKNLDKRGVYVYGVTQSVPATSGKEETVNVHNGRAGNRLVVPFSVLDKHVPPTFRKEWRGGAGQVVHHKFVVVDFNGENPMVFAGSSNLAAGGEGANGDNLVAITDRSVVIKYAVEALRLVDHYHFRSAMATSTTDDPLTLQAQGTAQPWWKPYYEKGTLQYDERMLLAGG